MPFSIEFCSAPIAVMTEMTEKTPMVIPIIVRAERNLFAPNELKAIFIISLNNMSILSRGFHHGEHGATMKLLLAVREPLNSVREHAHIEIHRKSDFHAAQL